MLVRGNERTKATAHVTNANIAIFRDEETRDEVLWRILSSTSVGF